ncbi:MAG: dienelactone hydrolase family protein [Pirellulaceae bacterium]
MRLAILLLLSCTAGIGVYVARKQRLAAEVLTDGVVVGDYARLFRIVIPHELPERPAVIIAYHGVGDTIESMAEYSQLDRLAVEHGMLVAFPKSHSGMWALSQPLPETWEEHPELEFFDNLLVRLRDHYAVDPKQIYVMGMSNGGSFAQLLGVIRCSEINCVMAHSGSCPMQLAENLAPQIKRPVLMIVGSDDTAVKNAMQADLENYHAQNFPAELIVVPSLGHTWSPQHNKVAMDFFAKHR